jgi:thiamine transporter ThiT
MEQVQYPQTTSNSMGTAAMVLGIIALVLSFIPIIGMVSWILAPLAIILGIIGMQRVPKGTAIAGLVTGGIALVICLLWALAFGAAVSNAATEAERMNQQFYSNSL